MQMHRYHVCFALWDCNDKLVQSISIYSASAGLNLCIYIRIRDDVHHISFPVEGTKTMSQSLHGGYVLRHLANSKLSNAYSLLVKNAAQDAAWLCFSVFARQPLYLFLKTREWGEHVYLTTWDWSQKLYLDFYVCSELSQISSNTGLSVPQHMFSVWILQIKSTRIMEICVGWNPAPSDPCLCCASKTTLATAPSLCQSRAALVYYRFGNWQSLCCYRVCLLSSHVETSWHLNGET